MRKTTPGWPRLVVLIYIASAVYWCWLCYCQGYRKMVLPTLPEAGQTVPRSNYTMHWNPVQSDTGTSYTIEISGNRSFSNVVFHQEGISITNVQAPLSKFRPGTYYWRVAAVIGSNQMPWSTRRKFVLE